MSVIQPFLLREADAPPLPSGWSYLTTEDASTQLKPGKLFDKKASAEWGAVPVLSQGTEDFIGFHDEGPGVEASEEQPVVTFANHTCAIRLMTRPFSCIQNIFPKVGRAGRVETRYFYYAVQGRVNLTDYKGHHPLFRQALIPLPPLEMQRRIACILGAYDDLIEVNRRQVAVLEEMARGLFEDWFIRFRFPGHEAVSLADTPDGPRPVGWQSVTLSQLCERITDGSHHSPPSVDDGKPMASVRDMREWGFDYSACRQIADAHWLDLARADCLPKVGDILIAKDGANLNKHTFLVWKDEPVVLLSSIAMIRPKVGIQREFLTAILRSPGTSAAIKNMRSGAAIPRIVLKDFKRLPITWPGGDIRSSFERLVHPLHQQCRTLVASSSRLAASRDLLLPRLISGQLSVGAAERELEEAA